MSYALRLEKYCDHLEAEQEKLESLTDDDHTVEEWIKMWVDEADGMEIYAIKLTKELKTLKDLIKQGEVKRLTPPFTQIIFGNGTYKRIKSLIE